MTREQLLIDSLRRDCSTFERLLGEANEMIDLQRRRIKELEEEVWQLKDERHMARLGLSNH